MTVYDFERKPVKTRKKHWCRYCGEVIPVGADGVKCESGFDEDGPVPPLRVRKVRPISQ